MLFGISDIQVPSYRYQVGNIIGQEVHSSVKIVRVNIHEGLTSVSIEEEYKLNVSVVNYVLFESKTESGQSRIKSRHLLRVL